MMESAMEPICRPHRHGAAPEMQGRPRTASVGRTIDLIAPEVPIRRDPKWRSRCAILSSP